ncbi:hypothetical protein AAFC00_003464 [Neodothiora populina]|uniref:CN hydrolase domain-containing protein n=1 Tax=Neodothiora populina TaxID=2781224 RepID=A0ABR3PE97_9PEZI
MKIGCLQFAPEIGQVEANISKADALLEQAGKEECSKLDLLVLPEMALSGYNFPNLEAIKPYLEPSSAGPSTAWAKKTAARYQCIVNVGYPEITTATTTKTTSSTMTTSTSAAGSNKTDDDDNDDGPKRYNTVVSVSPTGQILATYRKSFLYYTDETWASEGDSGFFSGSLSVSASAAPRAATADDDSLLENVAMGICMDINPYRFETPWSTFEFATHCVERRARLVLLSMAWLTRMTPEDMADSAGIPDLDTLAYWIERFSPVVKTGLNTGSGAAMAEGEETEDAGETRQESEGVVLVMANRCGMEPGNVQGVSQGVDGRGEDVVSYAGSSCVILVKNGNISIFDILGKAEERLLIVDTEEQPKFALARKMA